VVTKERPADAGNRRCRQILNELGRELHEARVEHGLSQAQVASAARISRSQVSRIERAAVPGVAVVVLARLLAVVGLELGARAYPAGQPIRDAAHRALIQRFRARVAPTFAWRFEVPLPIARDRRAWDAVLLIGTTQIAVEAETRPRDVQALQRHLALKRRDDPGIAAVVLVLADTRHNRELLRDHGDALRTDLPMGSVAVLEALGMGRQPGGSGLVLV
jgi:transcriptional regulator with XRE-family HTH domain